MRLVRCYLLISTLFLMIVRIVAGQDAVGTSEAALGGVPPLTSAVITRDLARLRLLLAAGHDPTRQDDQGFSPWMWAIHFGENEALKLLLARVPSIPATAVAADQKLAVAASLNNDVAVRALLAKGIPVDSPDVSGATPLLVAAANGYTDVMKILLAAGANPNRPDEHGDTPSMAASRIGSLPAVKLLLASGSSLNAKDRGARTALHWAARTGRADIVRALLGAGASVEAVDLSGRAPLGRGSSPTVSSRAFTSSTNRRT